jgi:glycosyltransferase involved in cell wall biosynthesis
MACGTPVVFGNNSSMLEVVRDAGLACNPDSPKDIMIQLQKILIDDDLRSNLSLKSIKQAQQFSWAKCAKETLKLYDKLLH